MPKVSVHIPCYNSEKYISEAIKSVLGQTFADFELIIINDGSGDGTEKIIKGFDDSRIRYFYQDNKGLAATRNKALSVSAGEYITFLDHDDTWLPYKLEKQVALLDAAPGAALAYSNFYRFFPDGKMIPAFKGKQPTGKIFEISLYRYIVGLCTVMVRKSVMDELNILFDEKLTIFEDYDVFMRILYRHEAVYTVEPLAVYRIHDTRSTMLFKNSYANEFEYTRKKLERLDPLFVSRYDKALGYLNGNIGHIRAKVAMDSHDRDNARKYLYPHIWSGVKFFLLYLLTFFPLPVWNKVHDIKTGGILL
jgi:glycosyltransferase involved in cell wall biosynthesis